MMSDEQRAERARQLLEDPVLLEMFALVKQDALIRFAESGPHDAQVREAAYQEIQGLELVQASLKNVLIDSRLKCHDQKG
jgi:hypothetical protein